MVRTVSRFDPRKTFVSLIALGAALANAPAAAENAIRLGIYAYGQPAGVVWSCSAVVGSLEKLMSEAVEHEIDVEVHLERDYDQGVADVLSGRVHLGRFPNVPSRWVVHPGTSQQLLRVWRSAVVELDIEPFLDEIAGGKAARAAGDDTLDPGLLAAVEARYGTCEDLDLQTASAAPIPGASEPLADLAIAFSDDARGSDEAGLFDLIDALPATAAGRLGHPAER